MSHIHTDPGQHDHTASAFIVRTDGAEPKLVLHMHRKLGKLMQPGGHVELHETPWQAVLHEITEETGYQLDQLRILQPGTRLTSLSGAALHPIPVCHNTHKFGDLDHYHTDSEYAFVADGQPAGSIAMGESDDVRYLTLQELKALGDTEILTNVKEVGIFVLEECLNNWKPVELTEFQS